MWKFAVREVNRSSLFVRCVYTPVGVMNAAELGFLPFNQLLDIQGYAPARCYEDVKKF
jgi:hypothetical protein